MPRIHAHKGAQNPNSALTEYQVIVIRHLNKRYYWKCKKLLRLFPQIGMTQMYYILNGTYWSDVKL